MSAIDQYLSTLAVADRDARRAALEDALTREGFVPALQEEEETEQNPRPARNYLIFPEDSDPFPLFCAHYDCYPGGVGANDNAAAVCVLISLAKALQEKQVRAGFAFFDGEEDGYRGAKLFKSLRGGLVLSAVINLDICGYGDTIAVRSKGNPKKDGARAFCDTKRLEAHSGKLVKFLPESDDICFTARQQPVLSVAVMPKWDLKYLNALATYNNSFLGKPPEFNMILGQLEVVTTMHGAFRDGLKWVQPEAMQQVYDYLLDAATASPEQGKRLGLF